MDDLATYLLDLVQNSIAAKAQTIRLTMKEETVLMITLEDDGVGIEEAIIPKVTSPFYTTRKTRKVGLGLSMIKMLTEQTQGDFHLESVINQGTILRFSMDHNHVDMPPIGHLGEMVYMISIHQDVQEFVFTYQTTLGTFSYVLSEIKTLFQETLSTHDVMKGIIDYIQQQIQHIRGES